MPAPELLARGYVLSDRKDLFSCAVARVVAAVAGVSCAEPDRDRHSVDWTFSDHETGASFSAQLKCTETVDPDGEVFSFPLSTKNYDDLRSTNRITPFVLVVVEVPDRIDDWVTHSAEELVLRRCVHWVNLRGMAATSNTTSVSVSVPRSQVFDSATVWKFLDDMLEERE